MFTAMRLLCSILFLFSLINYEVLASDSFHHCYSGENFTINSPCGGSRNGQLYGLAELVKQQDGFYEGNTITIPPSPVPYCFGLCRKDLISSDACYNCIGKSTSEILSNCPVQKEVIAWGGDAGCIVRCFPPSKSLRPYETYPAAHVCNKTNISHNYLPQFGHLLANLTSRIAVRAAEEGTTSSFPSGYNDRQYFATEESTLSDLHQTIYAVGFCIPSLSTSDCSACLQAAANKSSDYCSGKQGATVLMPSCVIRYELFPFYKISSATPLPSPSPSPPRSFPVSKGSKKRKVLLTAIILPLVAFLTITVLIIRYTGIWRRKKNTRTNKDSDTGSQSMESCHEFSLNTVRAATNDFSDSNKLGQGGFGVVYKGRLPNGKLVAIKRLTQHNARTKEEFKNEVQLVARLHHRNLTRLIGFCLGVKERILVYELAPNGSLDCILFDPIKREHLNWKIRQNIIEGIARGLVYLHEESQLRMIHRDLKASNVLLDESMNPKIADFGTARLYAEDEDSASKIVGTYGYMAPEYVKFGKISTKIDVFSFGVLLLEIVTGTKNSKSGNANRIEHLLSKAWKCWTTGELHRLIDPILLRSTAQTNEIKQYIHIGLLCVQENVVCR